MAQDRLRRLREGTRKATQETGRRVRNAADALRGRNASAGTTGGVKPRIRGPAATASPVSEPVQSRFQTARSGIRNAGGNAARATGRAARSVGRFGLRRVLPLGTVAGTAKVFSDLTNRDDTDVNAPNFFDRGVSPFEEGSGFLDFVTRGTTAGLRTIGDTILGTPAALDQAVTGSPPEQQATGIRSAGPGFEQGRDGRGGSGRVSTTTTTTGPAGATGLLQEAAGVDPASLPRDNTRPITGRPGDFGDARSIQSPGTGTIIGPDGVARSISATPEQRNNSIRRAAELEAERRGQAPTSEEGVRFKGDGIFSSLAQIGVNQGRIRQRNIEADRDLQRELTAFKEDSETIREQISASGAQSTASNVRLQESRDIEDAIFEGDPGARQTALQNLALNGPGDPIGTVGMSLLLRELDAGRDTGLFDKFMSLVGQDQSYSRDPVALFSAAGLRVDKNNNVVFGEGKGRFVSDLGDLPEDVQDFLLNDIENVRNRRRTIRGAGG